MKAPSLSRLFQALCALALPSASPCALAVQTANLLWRDGATLDIEGRGFPGLTSSPYVRIPDKWKDAIPEGVWRNSRTSMGMCFRFVTDSPTVGVRWSAAALPPPHPQMAPGGQTGIDIYRRAPGGEWSHCRMATPDPKTRRGELLLDWTPGDECLVYLPMRIPNLASFEIGVAEGSSFDPPPPHAVAKPVVHYGTSIVHGSRASRPGMAFPAIYSRLADVEVVNLGFPGLGKMELPMADLLAEIDASLYIVDCDWNMEAEEQQERYEDFVRRLREKSTHVCPAQPDGAALEVPESAQHDGAALQAAPGVGFAHSAATPILLCGGCTETGVARPQEVFAKGVYDKLKAEDPQKWANLHFLSGVGQLPVSSDATTDHIHPNDYGLAHMGPVYAEAVKHIIFANHNKGNEQ